MLISKPRSFLFGVVVSLSLSPARPIILYNLSIYARMNLSIYWYELIPVTRFSVEENLPFHAFLVARCCFNVRNKLGTNQSTIEKYTSRIENMALLISPCFFFHAYTPLISQVHEWKNNYRLESVF